MKTIKTIAINKKTKLELKREQERINNDLLQARLAKDAELIEQYKTINREDEDFNALDAEIQDLIDRTTEGNKPKRNVDWKEILKIVSPIAVAGITAHYGYKATKDMIKASQGEDFIDDKPLKIWTMIGKR